MRRSPTTRIKLSLAVASALSTGVFTGCSDPKMAESYEVRRDHQKWILQLHNSREVRCANNLNDLAAQLDRAQNQHQARLRDTFRLIDRAHQRDVQSWPDVTREAAQRFEREMSGDPANIEYTVPLMFY